MGLVRALLAPAARTAGIHAALQLRRFLRAHRRARQVQDALLRRLVEHHAESRFGRDFGLSAIRTCDDFRRAVPLGDYDTLRPYLQAVYEGDTGALFPPASKVVMFALTSGTTGEPKRIPITRQALADYRRGWNVFGIKLLQDHPAGWLRSILQISSPARESTSPTGLPCGAVSGLLAQTQMRIVRRMYPAPPGVMALSDPAARNYTILRLAMPQDVALISTANPSSVVQLMEVANRHVDSLLRDLRDGTLTPPGEVPAPLVRGLRLRRHPALVARIERGLAHDGELLCRHFWNLSALTHWTGGTLQLYLPQVRHLTGGVPIRDIGLLASEGRFSVPLHDETPEGVADITSGFLEFIPAGEMGAAAPTVLRSHELAAGEEYFLVLTNWAGLWRYNLNDRIRVTGFLGESPVFAFLSRGRHTVNLTGEKLTEHQFVQAVGLACRRLGLQVTRFLAQAHFASPPFYRLTVEGERAGALRLAPAVDDALQQLNIEYASKRKSGRLGPIQAAAENEEFFSRREAEIVRQRRGRNEQYKHQYLLTDVVAEGESASA